MLEFSNINYFSVLVSGIVFWLVGFLWFSVLFGRVWLKENNALGIKIGKAEGNDMAKKSIATLILNTLVAFGVSVVIHSLAITQLSHGICAGLTLGLLFAAVPMITAGVWDGRSIKLMLIDIGYPVAGILVSAIILTLWQ